MKRTRKRGWLGKCLFGAALGISHPSIPLHAQEAFRESQVEVLPPLTVVKTEPSKESAPTNAGTSFDKCGMNCCPCVPAWCDPVSRVPNFFGGFVGSSLRTNRNTITTQTLTYTGGGEGSIIGNTVSVGNSVFGISDITGPGGPYTVLSTFTGTGAIPTFAANENAELTAFIKANFPGATFANGTITIPNNLGQADLLLNYLYTTGQSINVNLANPSGGGLVGRNHYFDNGSPIPHDRVYFFYNHVGNFRGLGGRFDVNRYVFGAEKTFLGDFGSIEIRVPFAGTANSEQVAGQTLSVNNTEFGNIGIALKAAIYRTPNFIASVGFGLSAPSADDSRALFAGQTIVDIENRAWLLQPMVAFAWAPNDRFYAQAGLQLDVDPSGNPVLVRDVNGNLNRAGVLNDQTYLYATGALGYWLYQNPSGLLTGVALQGELNYNCTLGSRDSVQNGIVQVADLNNSNLNVLNATAGLNIQMGDRANMGVGLSLPVTSQRLYDWNLMVQFNYQFGSTVR